MYSSNANSKVIFVDFVSDGPNLGKLQVQ